MTSILPDNTYCAGDLTTETLVVKKDMNVANVESERVVTDIVQSDYAYAHEEIGSSHVEATHTITLRNESVNQWQDLIDNGYVVIPQPTPVPTMMIQGSGIFYNDYQVSRNNPGSIIVSNWLNTRNPYDYGHEMIATKGQQNISPSFAYSSNNSLYQYMDQAFNYTLKDSETGSLSMLQVDTRPNLLDNNGVSHMYMWSLHDPIAVPSSVKYYYPALDDFSQHYPITIYTSNIAYGNGNMLWDDSQVTYVYATDGRLFEYDEYMREIVAIGICQDGYWNLVVLHGDDLVVNAMIGASDLQGLDTAYQYNKDIYPVAFHWAHNQLMLVVRAYEYDEQNQSTTIYRLHFIVDYSDPTNLSITLASDYTLTSGVECYIPLYEQPKVITYNQYVMIVSGHSFDTCSLAQAAGEVQLQYPCVEIFSLNNFNVSDNSYTWQWSRSDKDNQVSQYVKGFVIGLFLARFVMYDATSGTIGSIGDKYQEYDIRRSGNKYIPTKQSTKVMNGQVISTTSIPDVESGLKYLIDMNYSASYPFTIVSSSLPYSYVQNEPLYLTRPNNWYNSYGSDISVVYRRNIAMIQTDMNASNPATNVFIYPLY